MTQYCCFIHISLEAFLAHSTQFQTTQFQMFFKHTQTFLMGMKVRCCGSGRTGKTSPRFHKPLAHLALQLLMHKLIDIILIDLFTEPAVIFKVLTLLQLA